MSWLSDRFQEIAPYIAPAIAIFAPEILPVIGTSLGASSAYAEAVGAAAVAGGSTAAAGGKPEDVAKSAGGAFIGAEVAGYAEPTTGKAVATGLGQTAGSLATGSNLETAAKQGLIAGAVQGAFGSPTSESTALDRALNVGEKYITSKELSNALFQPSPVRSAQTVGSGTTLDTSATTTGAGQAPGSQALGQALRIGDAGGTIFGSSDKEGGGKKSGWNVESLRYMGNSEA